MFLYENCMYSISNLKLYKVRSNKNLEERSFLFIENDVQSSENFQSIENVFDESALSKRIFAKMFIENVKMIV